MQLFSIVQAQINNPALSTNLTNGAVNGVDFTQRLLTAFIASAMVIAGVFFVFMIIFGGIKWITAGGDKAQTEGARKTLTSAVIGIVVVFALYAIVNLVGCTFFGIDLLNINIGELNVSFGACNPIGGATGTVSGGGGGGGIGQTGGGGGGGTGQTGGGGSGVVGNALCPGCITGGCGITSEVYQGAGFQHYRCTNNGWQTTNDNITTQTCGTCP